MLCDYGCGNEALYQFKNGKWCCCKCSSQCPNVKEKNSKKRKEQTDMNKEHYENSLKKYHNAVKNGEREVWNKGKTKDNCEGVKKYAETLSNRYKNKEIIPVWEGKHLPEEMKKKISLNGGGYRKGSGRGKHGYYKGIYCDSTYELAYLIYCLDHNIDIKRCSETFEYEYEGKKHKYTPDFIVENTIIEIKGQYVDLVDVKAESVDKPYKILYKEDLQEVFEYVAKTYNKKYDKSGNNFYELYDKLVG